MAEKDDVHKRAEELAEEVEALVEKLAAEGWERIEAAEQAVARNLERLEELLAKYKEVVQRASAVRVDFDGAPERLARASFPRGG